MPRQVPRPLRSRSPSLFGRRPAAGRRGGTPQSRNIVHHLLRRRQRRCAMAAQPGAGAPRPARISPTSCPASSCCRRRPARPTRRRAGPPEGPMSASRRRQAGRRRPARADLAAASEGHEIASHGCGHFDGGSWSKADWLAEFSAFSHNLRERLVASTASSASRPAGAALRPGEIPAFARPTCRPTQALYEALPRRRLRL